MFLVTRLGNIVLTGSQSMAVQSAVKHRTSSNVMLTIALNHDQSKKEGLDEKKAHPARYMLDIKSRD